MVELVITLIYVNLHQFKVQFFWTTHTIPVFGTPGTIIKNTFYFTNSDTESALVSLNYRVWTTVVFVYVNIELRGP